MDWSNFHNDFRLNKNKFNSKEDLLLFSKQLDESLCIFLEEWFNTNNFVIVSTSGSTGKPKKIKLLKKHVINSAIATGSYFNISKGSTALLCLPISYVAGKLMLIRAIVLGWKLDFIKPSSNPLKEISQTYDFTAFTPMQLENSIGKLDLIKKLIVGGGAISSTLANKLKNVNTAVFATYGMTETITHIAVKRLNKNKIQPTFFNALPNVKLYKDDRNCLVIKAPEVSDETIFTNDVVQLISNNEFNWLGRFDNVINSGGIKLLPEIIENKLAAIITSRFFVIGVPDDLLGEKLVLFIEGQEHQIDFKKSTLTKFERPKQIIFVPNFEETSSGKIQRKSTASKFLTQ